jgi:hypothetical protein
MCTFQIGETAGGAFGYTVMISNAPAAPFQQTLEELFKADASSEFDVRFRNHRLLVTNTLLNKISFLGASQR